MTYEIQTWTEDNFEEIFCCDFYNGVMFVCLRYKEQNRIMFKGEYKGNFIDTNVNTNVDFSININIIQFKVINVNYTDVDKGFIFLFLYEYQNNYYIIKYNTLEDYFFKHRKCIIYSKKPIISFYYDEYLYFCDSECVYKVDIDHGNSKPKKYNFKHPTQILCNYKLPIGAKNEKFLCGFEDIKGISLTKFVFVLTSQSLFKRRKRMFNLNGVGDDIYLGGYYKNIFIYSQNNIIYFVKNFQGKWYDSFIASTPEDYIIKYMIIYENTLYICCNNKSIHLGGVILTFRLSQALFRV